MGADSGVASDGHGLRSYDRLHRRPWFFAPPYLHGDLSGRELTLHTIQTPAAYEALRTEGTLVGDPALGEWHDELEFREAYDWMRRQMNRRLGTDSVGLLWFWAKTTYRELALSVKRSRGEVLLTVRVPRERVLLSHFDDWHMVLNRRLDVPLLPGESDEDWILRFDAILKQFGSRAEPYRTRPISEWPDSIRVELERSWESVFDLDRRDPPRHVQASMHQLHAGDVVRAIRAW